jgi:hypothetical protein
VYIVFDFSQQKTASASYFAQGGFCTSIADLFLTYEYGKAFLVSAFFKLLGQVGIILLVSQAHTVDPEPFFCA